jgi:hypothetical protein
LSSIRVGSPPRGPTSAADPGRGGTMRRQAGGWPFRWKHRVDASALCSRIWLPLAQRLWRCAAASIRGSQHVGWNRLRRIRAGVGGYLRAVASASRRHNCVGGGRRGKTDRRCCGRHGQRCHHPSAQALPGAHSSIAADPEHLRHEVDVASLFCSSWFEVDESLWMSGGVGARYYECRFLRRSMDPLGRNQDFSERCHSVNWTIVQ